MCVSTLHMSGQKLKKIAEAQYWSWNPEADDPWNPEADDSPSGYSSGIATLVVYIDL